MSISCTQENQLFLLAAAGYNPANDKPSMTGAHAGLPHPPAAGSTLPGNGASALGWNPALTASGLGPAGGNVDVRIMQAPLVVDHVAPYPGKD